MTREGDVLQIKSKVVVTLDICSSSDILEDLLKTDNIERWRNLLIWLKEYLKAESKKYKYTLYKFTGDGWIILFDPRRVNGNIIHFLSRLSKRFEKQFKEKIYSILDSPPLTTGLTFGIDEGPLIEMIMRGKKEYVGRAINVACRLQGIIHDLDIKAGYRTIISNRLYGKIRHELEDYSPQETKRKLRNIVGGKPFLCYRLVIDEDLFRILKANYWTENHAIDVTKEYIAKIDDSNLDVTVTNEIAGGDPDPGVRKNLTIEYIYERKKRTKTVKEGARIQLP